MTLLDQHTVLLHIPSSNPTTLKSINKTWFKERTPTIHY
jgi:hypothetical protein